MEWLWTKYKFINWWGRTKNYYKGLLLKIPYTISSIKCYSGRNIIPTVNANKFISDQIIKEIPTMICRFGETELRTIISYLQVMHYPYADVRNKCTKDLCNSAGFFPNDTELGQRFVDLMLKDCQYIDLCGIWNLYMEDYILRKYAPKAQLTLLGSLEPWSVYGTKNTKPWTSALAGKKVLVIHPFEESIRQQYNNNRERIFERVFQAEDILPEFELITLKAVQSIGCNVENEKYSDWFDALNTMLSKCREIEFDVAIIGCGAYGFPLAAEIKKMGKVAIHLGGCTQILFGIMGKRWEEGGYKAQMDRFVNEFWTRPSVEETPKAAQNIEAGCYW